VDERELMRSSLLLVVELPLWLTASTLARLSIRPDWRTYSHSSTTQSHSSHSPDQLVPPPCELLLVLLHLSSLISPRSSHSPLAPLYCRASIPVLRVQAKSSPQPIAVVAFAYSLPPAALQLEWVHSLPADAQGANCQLDINGASVYGTTDVLKALADAHAGDDGALGSDSAQSTDILKLLLLPPAFPPAFPTATAFLASLEQRLTLRTYAAANRPTVADYALFGALKTNTIAQTLLAKAPHTLRWYNHVAQLASVAKALVDVPAQAKVKPAAAPKAAKGAAADDDAAAGKANATFELGLPNAIKGHVVTRLPPEPSGYLHIGHAKAAVLNQYFARMYDGKFLVRFDDTNPSKEKAEFEQSIIEDLALLGIKADATSYTSDYFDQLQQYCVEMIKRGKAYADDTDQETVRPPLALSQERRREPRD